MLIILQEELLDRYYNYEEFKQEDFFKEGIKEQFQVYR